MASKDVSTTNTSANAPAKKPRGKPFVKGDSRRGAGFEARPEDRNNSGQRSKEVVATAAQARALYVQVLHEPINTPPDPDMSNLEMIVRQHVVSAKKGDAQAREQMFDRIWGKAKETIENQMSGSLELTGKAMSEADAEYLEWRKKLTVPEAT